MTPSVRPRNKRIVVQSLAAAFSAALCAGAIAQSYPAKPIRIVVPYAPGGAVDIVARAVGQDLTKRLGQTVLVENRTGAGGNVGSDAVAKAAPDGYTLLMASPANTINPSLYTKMSYDPMRDLVPIALIGSVPTVLIANRSLPVQNVKQLVALAKSQPGALVYGSGGSGTTEHLAGEIFKSAAGIDMLHVPYKGGAQVITDLLGGQIALMFVNQLGALPHITAGKVKALGVASTERSPALPQVPTFAEQGYPDMKVSVWWGIMGPAGIPKDLVNRLNREIVAALSSPEMQERLQTLSARPIGGTPEAFTKFFAEETTRWARVVKASGARVD
ncbi:MAG: Bug family tripartite tricarboxylate transporter substrate binding protein [Burkholderiales bacterium]